MSQAHEFHGLGDVQGHLNEQHHYYAAGRLAVGSAELLAIHRELHTIEWMDRVAREEDMRPNHPHERKSTDER